MFHFGKSCEISFQVDGSQEEQIHQKDLGVENELLAAVKLYMVTTNPVTTTKPAKPTTGYKRKLGVREPGWGKSCGVTGGGVGGEGVEKKILHRDIERQRRVVMAGLLNTLYSFLPAQFAKGKRSVSDQIGETINYIKHLQNNIKELQDKRDRLRKTSRFSSNVPCKIAIFTNNGILEIQINGGKRDDGFRLSDPLKVLLEEGLDVVCSVSTKINGISIHNIQCQMSDDIDVHRLQQRLNDVCLNNFPTIYEAGMHSFLFDGGMEKENQSTYSFLNYA